MDGSPQKQAGLFSFLMLLFFGIVLLIINPKSQIDNSPVIPKNIHNFLIILINEIIIKQNNIDYLSQRKKVNND